MAQYLDSKEVNGKTCPRCKEFFTWETFTSRGTYQAGVRVCYCRDCQSDLGKTRRERQKEYFKRKRRQVLRDGMSFGLPNGEDVIYC